MSQTDHSRDKLHELQRAVGELRILNEIAVSISATLGVEQVIELMLRKCTQHIGAEQGAVWLLDNEDDASRVRTFVRIMDQDSYGVPYKISASVTGWILKNRSPLLINDVSSDPRFGDMLRDYTSMRSLLAVPLTLQNRIIGILCLFNGTSGQIFTAEHARLLSIVAIQSAQTVENARLYEEEQVFRKQIEAARQVWQLLLPRKNPSIDGFDIVGFCVPAQEVGGDYYDFIEFDDGTMGIAVGDVVGKGLPAAMLMANLQSCLRSQALLTAAPSAAVKKINTAFTKFVDPGRFITLVYGILNPADSSFTLVNAGHTYPVLIRRSGDVEVFEEGQLVVGVSELTEYSEQTIALNSGDLLVLYSDGVTEAANEAGEFLGLEPAIELITNSRDLPADQIASRLLDGVKSFMGNSGQSDDITLVLVKAL